MGQLKYRMISGVLMSLALLAAAFWAPAWMALVILLAVAGLLLLEFYTLLDFAGIKTFKITGLLALLILMLVSWWGVLLGRTSGSILFGLMLGSALIWLRTLFARGALAPLAVTSGTLLGVLYAGVLFNFISLIIAVWPGQPGRWLILYLVLVVKAADTGAYFTGCNLGRHKMIPHVSPGKTWEGLVGGLLAAMLASGLVVTLTGGVVGPLKLSLGMSLALGLLLAVSGVLGDLVESYFKRVVGVKDSSSFIPGMGGLLDVLDSLLFAAPVLYFAARWLV